MKKEPEREKKKERKKDNSSWSFGGLISPLVESWNARETKWGPVEGVTGG